MEMTSARALALISALAAALWLGVIGLLHVIKPELDPRFRMVSEYARAPRGWIMQFAFFCVAVSCWALAAAIWTLVSPVGPALLIICGVGFAGAGVFVTDWVLPTQKAHTRSGALHNLFSAVVILLFPITATVVDAGVAGGGTWIPWLTVVIWAGVIAFIGAVFYSARRPRTPAGYFQRFMILAFSAWLMTIGFVLAR